MTGLSKEDRILWSTVARTVTPLKGKHPELVSAERETGMEAMSELDMSPRVMATQQESMMPPGRRPSRPTHLDLTTRKKLSKGSIPIDGRIDLHGLTQGEAHLLLLSFLHRAFMESRRYVLVITGKGSSLGSDGVLRRVVPAWMATPPFRAIVSAHESAARHHGGAGALYVRLRRKEGDR
ncbi:MAG TPA: Smr/MutS family protein [Rhizobiaceae bacterium]|nr:Smr/MutS family protein [Rhizobiaceae bacterium]